MTTDTIRVELTLAERHTLTDLLTSYIHERIFEDVQFARYSIDLERAAARTLRLAHLKALAEGEEMTLPAAELDELRNDLMEWALETEGTVDEHDAIIAEMDGRPGSAEEHRESIASLRETSAVDYAHKCVCERIIGQIDAARELVPA
jgi:hypothetical protein